MKIGIDSMQHKRRRSLAVFAGALIMLTTGYATASPDTAENMAATAELPRVCAPAPVGENQMRVTLLGTGTPSPRPDRFSASTLVQAGGLLLVFDAGRGASIRLNQALSGVPLGKIDGVFITHFHSDHVVGLDDLWMMGYLPAFGGREGGVLNVYGPPGVEHLAKGLANAFSGDADARVADGEVARDKTRIKGHDFDHYGVIYEKNGVKVTMFDVAHDPDHDIEPSVGYRVDYAGHSVLLSGDTIADSPNIIKYGDDVDLMIHEVAAFENPEKMQVVANHHTTAQEAGEIFTKTNPKLAVYSHIVTVFPDWETSKVMDVLVKKTRETYDGPLVVGDDLDSFLITDEGVKGVSLIPDTARVPHPGC